MTVDVFPTGWQAECDTCPWSDEFDTEADAQRAADDHRCALPDPDDG